MELLQVSESPPNSSSEDHSLHWPKQPVIASRLARLWNCCWWSSFFCQKVSNSPSFICKCHSSSCGSCSRTYSCCLLAKSPAPTPVGPLRVGPTRVGPTWVGPTRVGPASFGSTPAPAADSHPDIWTHCCLSFKKQPLWALHHHAVNVLLIAHRKVICCLFPVDLFLLFDLICLVIFYYINLSSLVTGGWCKTPV